MAWEEYERLVTEEWKALLDSEQCDEQSVHRFLVRHPSMIPGAYSVTGPSGHCPFPMAVLSESPLSGIGMRVPDFIWLATDSLNFTPVFIEIESPRKRWFTKQGVPTHALTQAMNQLAQWQMWLNQIANRNVFLESFEIPDYMARQRNFRAEFVLIYGRRKEFDDRPELSPLRAQFERHGQVVMTFDRLHPSKDCSLFLSATKRNGGYQALAVPATMRLGPSVTMPLLHIAGIPDAIQQNAGISEDRRRFLIERIPYWTAWARGNKGIISSGDFE
jgi:hypothetical protein